MGWNFEENQAKTSDTIYEIKKAKSTTHEHLKIIEKQSIYLDGVLLFNLSHQLLANFGSSVFEIIDTSLSKRLQEFSLRIDVRVVSEVNDQIERVTVFSQTKNIDVLTIQVGLEEAKPSKADLTRKEKGGGFALLNQDGIAVTTYSPAWKDSDDAKGILGRISCNSQNEETIQLLSVVATMFLSFHRELMDAIYKGDILRHFHPRYQINIKIVP